MNALLIRPAMVLICLLSTQQPTNKASRLRVEAKLQSKTAWVGQARELQLAIVAEKDAPEVVVPEIEGGSLVLFGSETVPQTVTAIGDAVREQTLFRYRYRIVPTHVGTLLIPPFRATAGDRRGASLPLKLKVESLPREGRTGNFLGGVGTFELKASAMPNAIPAGGDFEFRIKVDGTAARGMSLAPSLERLTKSQPGLKLGKLPDLVVDEPPSRQWSWRIRPSEPGRLKVPPISIAAFDSKLARYFTKATQGIDIRVEEPPKFDPKTLNYGQSPTPRRTYPWLVSSLALMIPVALYALGKAWFRPTKKAFASRILKRIHEADETAEIGPIINELLKRCLAQSGLHSTGALTPYEAKLGVIRLSDSDALGDRADALISKCDRLSFDEECVGDHSKALKHEASSFFEDLLQSGIQG